MRRRGKAPLLVAIDGRCAAGKTTLAAQLQERSGCSLIHMDHFFLRPEQRTAERLSQPGGNVDYERFHEEVMAPLKRGEPFSYRPYDCRTRSLTEEIRVELHPVSVIEGAYSCHPALRGAYDLTIFLTVNGTEQLGRIRRRNGERQAAEFREKWIPLEERYFAALSIERQCDLVFQTDSD